MTQTITHNRFDADGNIIDTFEVPVKPSNETDTDIYLTKEWLYQQAARGRKGNTNKADYTNIGKTVWYCDGELPDRQVVSMACDHNGTSYQVVFKQPSGKDLVVLLPVK